jgi:hypothetical protein
MATRLTIDSSIPAWRSKANVAAAVGADRAVTRATTLVEFDDHPEHGRTTRRGNIPILQHRPAFESHYSSDPLARPGRSDAGPWQPQRPGHGG